MKIIEAKNQSGTVAFYDEKENKRTQWVLLELDESVDEEKEKEDFTDIVKDFIEDSQPDWISADDLEDGQGQILYNTITERID
jgi:hypothetical protein